MRILENLTNVDPASLDYPKGRIRNKQTGILGTVLDEGLIGDLIQFFQKLVVRSGITENDSPDNETNDYQMVEIVERVIGFEFQAFIDDDGTVLKSKGPQAYTFTKSAIGRYDIDQLGDADKDDYLIHVTGVSGSVTGSKIACMASEFGSQLAIRITDEAGTAEDGRFYISITKFN